MTVSNAKSKGYEMTNIYDNTCIKHIQKVMFENINVYKVMFETVEEVVLPCEADALQDEEEEEEQHVRLENRKGIDFVTIYFDKDFENYEATILLINCTGESIN